MTMKTMQNKNQRRAGFTLTELLVAVSISTVVMVAVLNVFIWGIKQSMIASKSGWSQREALMSSEKISQYIRNSSEIIEIDLDDGHGDVSGRKYCALTLLHPDGSTNTLVYTNTEGIQRDGRMMLLRNGSSNGIVVARGLTGYQNSDGYAPPVFQLSGEKVVRVAYRVSEPTKSGGRDVNDGQYAAYVRFSACLRNFME